MLHFEQPNTKIFRELFADPLEQARRAKETVPSTLPRRVAQSKQPKQADMNDDSELPSSTSLLTKEDEVIQRVAFGRQTPFSVLKFLVATLFVAVAYWIYKPLGAYLAVLYLGGYGAWFIWRASLFWTAAVCMIFGCFWGLSMASLAWILAFVALKSSWAKVLLQFFGLLGLGYIGFPTRSRTILTNWEDKILLTQLFGILAYLTGSGGAWLYAWLHH